ncbi:MAG: nuclear transport factor 2 family protein, partial [Bacteroidota bacterium]|nr:nuclear transport factor 2 family protein [Bacteroidota bacterium]
MNAEKEILLKATYDSLINVALFNHPIGEIEYCISESFMGYGTARDEKVFGLKEFVWMLERQRKELGDVEFRIRRFPVTREEFCSGNSVLIVEEFETSITTDDAVNSFILRLSTVLEYKSYHWMICHFHGSIADANTQQGDAWPIEEWKRRNAELQKLVDEKTSDLLLKNRELEIEAALERVRARAMGMQKSEELSELVTVVFNEMTRLNVVLSRCMIWIYDPVSRNSTAWMASPEKNIPDSYSLEYNEHEVWQSQLAAWKERTPNWMYVMEGETKKSWDKFLFSETGFSRLPDVVKQAMQQTERAVISASFNNFGGLVAVAFEPFTEQEMDLLQRFGKVFDLTYTRFNDLQKAEAQAREAQIELGLERVRAKAMAMQNSEELNTLIGTVFTELTKLDLVLTRCVIIIYDPNTNDARWWMANSEAPEQPMNFLVKYHEHPPNLAYFKAWEERTLKWQYILEGTIKKEWDDFLFSETELSLLPDFVIAGMRAPEQVYLNASFNNFGNLTLASLEQLSNEHFGILLRFAKVFDLTYTRFNDLKQAEAQAREAQIELGLERVRARAMSMHHSDELLHVITELKEQLLHLNFHIEVANFNTNYRDKDWDLWMSSIDDLNPTRIFIPYFDHPIFINISNAINKGEDFIAGTLTHEEKNRFLKHLYENTIIKYAPEEGKQYRLSKEGFAYS